MTPSTDYFCVRDEITYYTCKVKNKKANVLSVGWCGDACFNLTTGAEMRPPRDQS